MLREQPRVQALLAGPGGARYVINTSRSIYSACIGAWCQVQFRSKRTIQTRPFPNRALQHTKDDNNLSQGYGPFGFTKNFQQHSKVGRAGTKIISTLEAKKTKAQRGYTSCPRSHSSGKDQSRDHFRAGNKQHTQMALGRGFNERFL